MRKTGRKNMDVMQKMDGIDTILVSVYQSMVMMGKSVVITYFMQGF